MAIETVLDQHITVMSGVAGGKPRIAGHRITVLSRSPFGRTLIALGPGYVWARS